MKRNALVAAMASTLLAATPLAALAQTQAAETTMGNDLPPTDKVFVQAASSAGSTEIDAAKLASTQSQDKDVRSFAHHMLIDHTKLAMQLKMAAPHGVSVPKDNSDVSVLDSLRALHGKEFDTAYIQKVGVQGHQEAVQALQKEAQDGQNPSLKKAAQKALPTIEEHLEDGAGARGEEGRAVSASTGSPWGMERAAFDHFRCSRRSRASGIDSNAPAPSSNTDT